MAKVLKLTDQLRQAIETCGKTRYRIAKETGISQTTFSRFMNGKGGLSPDVLDRLGKYLGLRIVMDQPKRKGK